MSEILKLDPKTTALILIDLQNGIVGLPLAPWSAAHVVETCADAAQKLREAGGMVVYVRVDMNDMHHAPSDQSLRDLNAPPPPATASELTPAAGFREGDVLITKRQWGAFYGTELDQKLRRRGIRTIVLGGIATNMGVESTARAAHDQGYHLVFLEDGMSTISAEAHAFATKGIFPLMGKVRSAAAVLEALA